MLAIGLVLAAVTAVSSCPSVRHSAEVQGALGPYVERGEIAGVISVLSDKDYNETWDLFGFADVESKRSMAPDTVFAVFSMSKTFLGAAMMCAIDDGVISLDDKVSKFLPEYADVRFEDGRKPAREITVRDITCHADGLRKEQSLMHGTKSLREVARRYAAQPLVAEPGTTFKYGTTRFAVAGACLEVATGKRFEDYLEERILRPLGMVDTTFNPNPNQIARLVKAYTTTGGPFKPASDYCSRKLVFPTKGRIEPSPGGGLFSTAADMIRFSQMLAHHGDYKGKTIISRKTFDGIFAVLQVAPGIKQPYTCGSWLYGDWFGHEGAMRTDQRANLKTGESRVFFIQTENAAGKAFFNAKIAWHKACDVYQKEEIPFADELVKTHENDVDRTKSYQRVMVGCATNVESIAAEDFSGCFPPTVRTVGVVMPASILAKEKFDRGVAALKRAGYRVKLAPRLDFKRRAPVADRVADLEELWLDPEVDLLICARGGQGAEDVVSRLDWQKLARRPDQKLLGFSNITMLLNGMVRTGVGHPYSGPSLGQLLHCEGDTKAWLRKALAGEALPATKLTAIRPGSFEGLPCGGHIGLVLKGIRIGWNAPARGRVVFLERNRSTTADGIRRELLEIAKSGALDGAAGIVFGDVTPGGMQSGENWGEAKELGPEALAQARAAVEAAKREFAAQVTCPVYDGFVYGHIPVNHTIDFRRKVRVSEDGTLTWDARAFTNDICLPSKLWMLSEARNDVFFKAMTKRWRPYNDFVRCEIKSSGCRFQRHLSHVVSFDQPVDGTKLTFKLVNGDEFETVKELKTVLCVGQSGKGEKDVVAQIVGDSFTHGEFFRQALLGTNYVPRLRLVGLCRCGGRSDQHAEGRGGWRLDTYFKIPKGERFCYHGFMHPTDGRYWGDRSFWKMAWRCVRKTQPKGFQPTYSCARFDDCVGRFDEQTGVLLDPKDGDVQYDPDQKTMVRFDGKTWQAVDEKAMTWKFDYGKYLAMWNLEKPQFLFEVLGLNDFGNEPMDADYSKWEEMLRTFKESYQAACPNGKFVVCTPCSACGIDDNAAGSFLTRENAVMWRFRDWLIQTYDRREQDGYYLLDTAVATDNDHGYAVVQDGPVVLPYESYKGQEKLHVQQYNPHPYPNYPAMGTAIAAFLQYFRD